MMKSKNMINFLDYGIPEHTKISLENYLLYGIPPGGFLTSVLVGDLFNVFAKSDYMNKPKIEDIVNWIKFEAPMKSYGSYENMKYWITDPDKLRANYAEQIEKQYVWRSLKTVGN